MFTTETYAFIVAALFSGLIGYEADADVCAASEICKRVRILQTVDCYVDVWSAERSVVLCAHGH